MQFGQYKNLITFLSLVKKNHLTTTSSFQNVKKSVLVLKKKNVYCF
jgi:hypothetical protein